MMRLVIVGLTWVLLFPGAVGLAPAFSEETVLVPFGSTIRYATFEGTRGDVPDEVYALDYDDSGWPVGAAPFGSSDDVVTCPIDAATPWPTGTTLVARIWVDVPAGSRDLRFLRKYTGFSGIGINGEGFGSCSTSGSPCPWWYCDQTAPYEYGGPVLITVTHESYPWNVSWTYMDIQISADVPSSAVKDQTWSMVKSLYR